MKRGGRCSAESTQTAPEVSRVPSRLVLSSPASRPGDPLRSFPVQLSISVNSEEGLAHGVDVGDGGDGAGADELAVADDDGPRASRRRPDPIQNPPSRFARRSIRSVGGDAGLVVVVAGGGVERGRLDGMANDGEGCVGGLDLAATAVGEEAGSLHAQARAQSKVERRSGEKRATKVASTGDFGRQNRRARADERA